MLMFPMALPIRRLQTELLNLIDKEVEVYTTYGKRYVGKLLAIDSEKLNLALSNARDESGNVFSLLVLHGAVVGEIKLSATYIDLKDLAEKLEKYFPKLIAYDNISRVITVAEKVRILPDGTIEGSGPIADKVRAIFNELLKK